jgi:2-furoyl-CoA dehydrogenase large subunit
MTSFQPATESPAGHIGARQARVEDAALLRGLGCYADDAKIPPGTLHAAIIRSPRAHARITSVDVSTALLMKGAHGMPVGEEVKRWALPIPVGVRQPMEHWCVAVDKVRYVGEPVAVVIAESRYLAAWLESAVEPWSCCRRVSASPSKVISHDLRVRTSELHPGSIVV